MVLSDRAWIGPISPMTMPATSGTIVFISQSLLDIRPRRSALTRLQCADVFYNLIDLCVREGCTEGRHRAFFCVCDAVAKKVVVSLCIHQLRPLAGAAAPIGVTKAARRCEQLFDI